MYLFLNGFVKACVARPMIYSYLCLEDFKVQGSFLM